MFTMMRKNLGFTLIQLAISVVALGIAGTVAVKVIEQSVAQKRRVKVTEQIQAVQRAIFGDTRLRDQGNFGFVGDVGRLPANLNELLVNSGAPGWNGPYITGAFLESANNPFSDPWGALLKYDNTTGLVGLDSTSNGGIPIVVPIGGGIDPTKARFGSIEGKLFDIENNNPKKGDRRNILVWMEKVSNPTSLPPLTQDLNRDNMIFHLDRVWLLHHPVLGAYHRFTDEKDESRGHWRNNWKWARTDYEAAYLVRTGDLLLFGYSDESIALFNQNTLDVATIDKIRVKWTGSKSSQNLTKITLGGQEIWSGEAKSGTVIDISNVDLQAGAANVPLKLNFDFFAFLNLVQIDLTMSDESKFRIRFPFDKYEPGVLHVDDDDHEEEFENEGSPRRFDHHFANFWVHFFHQHQNDAEFLKVDVFIHPDRQGFYKIENIPVGAYVITAHHHKLQKSIKRHVIIQPNKLKKQNFKYDVLFPGFGNEDDDEDDPPGDDEGDDPPDDEEDDSPPPPMSERIGVSGNLTIDGSTDDDVALANPGSSDIVVDKIRVSWTNPHWSKKLKKIRIDGSTKWSGGFFSYKQSGSTVDITDYTLTPGASNKKIKFEFSGSLAGRTLTLKLIMSDGSEIEVASLPVTPN